MRLKFYLLPAAIIVLGIALRVYQLEQLAGFNYDQEVAAFWIKELVVNHKFSLIGQEISVGGVYIAPFFYYLLTPFYLLTKLYPLGGNIFVALVAGLAMIMIYRLANQVFGKPTALIATFLYAIHPGIINVDRTVAPSNLIILLSVTTAYLLTKPHRSSLDMFILGIILGLTFSVHPTAVLLIPIVGIFFLVKKEKVSFKNLALIILPAILLISPLVLFDLRHNGLIVHNALTAIFSSSGGKTPVNLISHFFSMAELVLVYWAGTLISNDNLLVKLPLFILAIWTLIRGSSVLRLWVAIPLAALVFYPKHIPEYYFLLLTPVVLVYTVGFLQKGRIGSVLLAIIVLVSILVSLSQHASSDNELGLYYKNEAVKYIIRQADGQPFTVYYSNEPGEAFGFDYLFWWHKAKLADKMPTKFLVVVPISSRVYHPSADFGRIKVVTLQE